MPQPAREAYFFPEWFGTNSKHSTVCAVQRAMSFIQDQEDVVSMSLTVVQSLLEKYSIGVCEIGR